MYKYDTASDPGLILDFFYHCFARQVVAQSLLPARRSNDHFCSISIMGLKIRRLRSNDRELCCRAHSSSCAVRVSLILASVLVVLRCAFPCLGLFLSCLVLMGPTIASFRASKCGNRPVSATILASEVPLWFSFITDVLW